VRDSTAAEPIAVAIDVTERSSYGPMYGPAAEILDEADLDWIGSGQEDNRVWRDALAKIKVSVQIVEGERDQLVLPVAADYIAAKVKHAKKSYYPHVGHAPTIEDTERFNRERP